MVEGKSRVIDFGNDRYKHEIDLVARTLNGVKFRDVIHNARRNIKKADEQEVKARTPVNALDPKEYSEDFFMVLRYGSRFSNRRNIISRRIFTIFTRTLSFLPGRIKMQTWSLAWNR